MSFGYMPGAFVTAADIQAAARRGAPTPVPKDYFSASRYASAIVANKKAQAAYNAARAAMPPGGIAYPPSGPFGLSAGTFRAPVPVPGLPTVPSAFGTAFAGLRFAGRFVPWLMWLMLFYDLLRILQIRNAMTGWTHMGPCAGQPSGSIGGGFTTGCNGSPGQAWSYTQADYALKVGRPINQLGVWYWAQGLRVADLGGNVRFHLQDWWRKTGTLAQQPQFPGLQTEVYPRLKPRRGVYADPMVPTWVDPLTQTPSQAEPLPIPPPYRVIPNRQPNPWRSPSEQTEWPYVILPVPQRPDDWKNPRPRPQPDDDPDFPPLHPRPPAPEPDAFPPLRNFELLSNGTVKWAPEHRRDPPDSYTKERKARSKIRVPKFIGGVTEALEFANIMFDCLPKKIRHKVARDYRKEFPETRKKKDLKENPLPSWWGGDYQKTFRGGDKIDVSVDAFDKSGYAKGYDGWNAIPMGRKMKAVADYLWQDEYPALKLPGPDDKMGYLNCVLNKAVENQFQDKILGKIGSTMAKSSLKLGFRSGVQTGPVL